MTMYHISVDAGRCQGHARCLAFAPDVFDFDDEGYAFVPDDKSDRADLDEDLRLAVANCPERAIIVSEVSHAGS
ncbi:ferredoxin [Mycolicibacterium sp.]|uniref:ferredoxin n=1 Tax=Mycolicibacterium sp. TaxID=2320850 RepID=UPI003D117BE7